MANNNNTNNNNSSSNSSSSNNASATIVNNGSQQQQLMPQHNFQQPNSAHHCKECGLFFDSAKSLEVHLQYHKENLLNKWANQAAGHSTNDQETNNNNNNNNNNGSGSATTKNGTQSSLIIINNNNKQAAAIAAPADSSDSMHVIKNKSPDSYGSRATPEGVTVSFGHPPTPQSYHSASSPYQTHADQQQQPNFSSSYLNQQQQSYQPVKSERASPYAGNGYSVYPGEQQYFGIEQLGYPQDYPVHKMPTGGQNQQFRYHPYAGQYDRSPQVSSSSPAYPSQNPQPTPSPSPKQCDKCGCVCDSAAQLIEHLNHAHPQATLNQLNHHQQQQQFINFNNNHHHSSSSSVMHDGVIIHNNNNNNNNKDMIIKQEGDEPQTEILDLDSHKVHHVFQTQEEEDELHKRNNGDMSHGNPHSVTAMLGHWPAPTSNNNTNNSGSNSNNNVATSPTHQKMQQQQQQHFSNPSPFVPHQMHQNDYIVQSGVTTTNQQQQQDSGGLMSGYRPFEHLPPQPNPPVISSSATPSGPVPKGATWKSNEARRPKTYNCSACNKWFTSSGHLKRHYNTTLHKNAVKSSGQPDPATLPISAHHHPGREERDGGRTRPDSSNTNHSPDSIEQDARLSADAGDYPLAYGADRPLSGSPLLTTGSPPNGEAGPSASLQDHLSRGLLSISTVNTGVVSPMGMHSTISGSSQQQQQQQQQAFGLFPNHHHQHMMAGTSPLPDTSTQQPFHHQLPLHHHQQQIQSPSIPPNYPNGSAPHVTPMVISSQPQGSTSLTITGDQYGSESIYQLIPHHLQQQQQQQQQFHHNHHHQSIKIEPMEETGLAADQSNHQPLPSFAQFHTAHHRYGILLAPPGYQPLQANVGGTGPATDPLYHNSITLTSSPTTTTTTTADGYNIGDEPSASPQASYASPAHYNNKHHHLVDEDDNYEITVLENAAAVDLPYSPPNHNNNYSSNNGSTASLDYKVTKGEPASPQPPSIETIVKAEQKHDYEHGSPQITSTGSPLGPNGAGKVTSNSGVGPNGLHKCFDCNKVFNKACYLTQHNKTFHCGDKPFKCNRCGKRFLNDSTYQEHLAKHAGDKPYKCELCPKQFNHKTDLRRHMCLHTGQKPYACGHCGKGFIRKDHMLKHAETHSRKSTHHSKQHHHQSAAAATTS